ncbi:MAG: hypothetical protein PHC88_14240 [Terrimicrobiaceae bacterium]|nr:hypothetical protein [Terrimicrobiaceae bacterium]
MEKVSGALAFRRRMLLAQCIGATENIRPRNGSVNEKTVAQVVVDFSERSLDFHRVDFATSRRDAQRVEKLDPMNGLKARVCRVCAM